MLVLEVALFVTLFAVVSAYQTRELLDTDRQPAPTLRGVTVGGSVFDLAASTGRPVLVYFFAPWCPFCAASADNVVRLKRWRSESLDVVVVALDWKDEAEVRAYVEEHELDTAVVLGGPAVANDWKVQGFPTYYVLDSAHRIVRRDFGYSTQFGLWWRTWRVE